MGYLTCYDILLLEGTEDDFQNFLKDLALESDYAGLKEEGELHEHTWAEANGEK